MTTLRLSPVERELLRQAAVGESEARDMEASRLLARVGNTTTVQEWREEAAVLRNASAKLAGDQSPALSRALAPEELELLGAGHPTATYLRFPDTPVRRAIVRAVDLAIAESEELDDARFLEANRAARREVSHRYTSGVGR